MPTKTYAIFDLDGTITKRDTYLDYLLSYYLQHPSCWFKGVALGIYACLYALKIKDNTWLKQRFLSTLFAGKSAKDLAQWNKQFVEKTMETNIRHQAKGAIYLHKQTGHVCVLLSASLDLYVPDLASALGFEHCICTQIEWKEGRITGLLNGENVKGIQKCKAWADFIQSREDHPVSTIAYGDHDSDLQWLTSVGHGVLISSKPKLVERAKSLTLEVQQW